MEDIKFQAFDYTSNDDFVQSDYQYKGSESAGWEIFRNGDLYLKLGSGYELLETKYCGICSTDLARRFLPFPLPQIIGHELIAKKSGTEKLVAVEINDTSLARGDAHHDSFVTSGLDRHSPSRQVLGIDRLPGGFGKYILAPKNAMIPVEGLGDPEIAVLIEPFAATLQAIMASPPQNGETIAVLGPRRLGGLLLAALKAYRTSNKLDFTITALVRRDDLIQRSLLLGADKAINLTKTPEQELSKAFDKVYDTTGSPEGFSTALKLSKKEVHLKSTNGQPMGGVNHLTELVVDELSILPFSEENLSFVWPTADHKNESVLLLSKQDEITLPSSMTSYPMSSAEEAFAFLQKDNPFGHEGKLPRFDVGIATSVKEIESMIRPVSHSEESLIRPRGAILYKAGANGDCALLEFLTSGGTLRSSRCGDFEKAIRLLEENPDIAKVLKEQTISDTFLAKDVPKAYDQAKTKGSIKVLIKHE